MKSTERIRVAIDGPAGAGKSTVAKRLAIALGVDYIDSGAMYRAIALKLVREGIDYRDGQALAEMLERTEVDFKDGHILLDGEIVDLAIRTPEVSKMASDCSTILAVREKLVALQRAMGETKSLVMDGRDIGTNVLPRAEYKFYLTASPGVRAKRRTLEMIQKGENPDIKKVEEDIIARDHQDSTRAHNPLRKADDALEIDSSELGIEEVVGRISEHIKSTEALRGASKPKGRIKILKNGPYLVSGGIPLSEKKIVPGEGGYQYEEGRPLPQAETYTLCRCGKSKNPPFCDGAHVKAGFIGTELASREKYEDRAERIAGPGVDLLDDGRCAYARFCHRGGRNVWQLVDHSHSEKNTQEAIRAASDCPTGRLTAVDKSGQRIEPFYEPAIHILQDTEEGVSSGIAVFGGIPIEGADGFAYEIRNRVVLCRCGRSWSKPFCNAAHVSSGFIDRDRDE